MEIVFISILCLNFNYGFIYYRVKDSFYDFVHNADCFQIMNVESYY